jgi:tRNA A37 methylthiotransferase MiaB
MDNLSLHVKNFNDRVRVMNQTGQKELTLSATDARNLHSDIYALLSLLAELSGKLQVTDEVIAVNLDGGSFK